MTICSQRRSFFNVQPWPGKPWSTGSVSTTVLTSRSTCSGEKGGGVHRCDDKAHRPVLLDCIGAPNSTPSPSCVRFSAPKASRLSGRWRSYREPESVRDCGDGRLLSTSAAGRTGSVPSSSSLVEPSLPPVSLANTRFDGSTTDWPYTSQVLGIIPDLY
jgi:hypothetical protein